MCCLDKEGPSRGGCVQRLRRVKIGPEIFCGYAPTLTLEPRAAPDATTPSRSLLVHPAHGFAFYVANTLKVTFRVYLL
ncbi:hypothetical protein PVL29_002908 [Vitis rotundifolia]|uniref:Uncharacterized protein n=1 Tax=Vitis rotundifolia TaxID=103349 RepID=A0AA39E2U5_VITRO|nr:hypothetical protein PVL29_002908 [Vitis rotundifolia]